MLICTHNLHHQILV